MSAARPGLAARAQALRRHAARHPDVVEATVCNRTSFKSRNRAFLFMGTPGDTLDIMVKLKESMPEARALASGDPARCRVGGHGWVTVIVDAKSPPMPLLRKWIDESFRLLVPARAATARSRRS